MAARKEAVSLGPALEDRVGWSTKTASQSEVEEMVMHWESVATCQMQLVVGRVLASCAYVAADWVSHHQLLLTLFQNLLFPSRFP